MAALLDGVAQLADVARPGTCAEFAQDVLREPGFRDVRQAGLLQEMLDQGRDVLAPVAKAGWQVDLEHAEAEEQVLAKPPAGHEFGKRLVRGGEDADIGRARARVADRRHLVMLDGPEELYLETRRGECLSRKRKATIKRNIKTPTPAPTSPVTVISFGVEKVKISTKPHAPRALALAVGFSGALDPAAAQNLAAYTVFSGKIKKAHKVSTVLYNKFVPLTQAIYFSASNIVALLPRGAHALPKLEQLQVNVAVLTDPIDRSTTARTSTPRSPIPARYLRAGRASGRGPRWRPLSMSCSTGECALDRGVIAR